MILDFLIDQLHGKAASVSRNIIFVCFKTVLVSSSVVYAVGLEMKKLER